MDAPERRLFGRPKAVELTPAQAAAAAAMLLPHRLPFKLKQAEGRSARSVRKLKNIVLQEEYDTQPVDEPNFVNIEAPPSVYPPKKYCDITGQLAKYTDPQTKLHYVDAAAFAALRRLPPEAVQERLALRRADFKLK